MKAHAMFDDKTGPFYPDQRVVGFMQGELVSAARAVLHAYRRNVGHLDSEFKQQLFNEACAELARLVSNAFQYRNELGDEVQLSKLILFMHGEQSEIW